MKNDVFKYLDEKEKIILEISSKWKKYASILNIVSDKGIAKGVYFSFSVIKYIPILPEEEYITKNVIQYINIGYIPVEIIVEDLTGKKYIKFITPIEPKKFIFYEIEEVIEGLTLISIYKGMLNKRKVRKDVNKWSFQVIVYFIILLSYYEKLNLKIILENILDYCVNIYNKKEKIIIDRHLIYANDWKGIPHIIIEYYEDKTLGKIIKRMSFPILELDYKEPKDEENK